MRSSLSWIAPCLALAFWPAAATALAAERGNTPTESPEVVQARQHVAAALAAEARGDNESRGKQLEAALAIAPDFSAAQWHLAKVKLDDKWLTLAEAEQQTAADPRLAEYRQLRTAATNAALLRNLARWCNKTGWDDRARVHYAQLLTRTDATADSRQEAIKNLDLHYAGGSWISGEDLQAQKEEAGAADVALRKLRPRLEPCKKRSIAGAMRSASGRSSS